MKKNKKLSKITLVCVKMGQIGFEGKNSRENKTAVIDMFLTCYFHFTIYRIREVKNSACYLRGSVVMSLCNKEMYNC